MTDLTGKTAIIPRSTSAIEPGLARGFAQAGANVVLNGFGDADEIESTRGRGRDHMQCNLSGVCADAARPEPHPQHRRSARYDQGRGQARCAVGGVIDHEIRNRRATRGRGIVLCSEAAENTTGSLYRLMAAGQRHEDRQGR